MNTNSIVIVGASAAGVSAAREIRSISYDIPIQLITEENHQPYYRPLLTEFIGDSGIESRPNFYLNPPAWYVEKKIGLLMGQKVISIDPAGKTVRISSGNEYPYGKLILANGSTPFVPFNDAAGKKGFYSVRTLDDARNVYEHAGTAKTAIVIGGGLLGLEVAYSLTNRGVQATVIEISDRLLPRQLDSECSIILQNIVAKKNVTIVMGVKIDSILGDGRVTGVRLASGEVVSADLIVVSIGVRPNSDLAKNCGIAVNRAVVVNERMETSAPEIYACGDVAEFNGITQALWMPAIRHGKVAGSNAAGKPAEFVDEVYPATMNSFGTRIFSVGDLCLDKKVGEYKLHIHKDMDKDHYKKLFFIDDRLVGVILIGDISESRKLTMSIKNGALFKDVVK
jgi:NAD(P)H-nitrite reductase large subunit